MLTAQGLLVRGQTWYKNDNAYRVGGSFLEN